MFGFRNYLMTVLVASNASIFLDMIKKKNILLVDLHLMVRFGQPDDVRHGLHR